MPDYSVMYKELFQAVTRTIDALQEAQIKTEELYIDAEPTAITVLHGGNQQCENKAVGTCQIEILDKETLSKLIGENIRVLRQNASMSLEELAEKLLITPGFLGLVERGRRNVNTHNLICLSNTFSIPIDDLFKPLSLETKEIKEISAT